MKNGLTEIVFILDKSGSMYNLESDTIGGFNSMLDKQKKECGEANITTVLFNDKINILHNRVPIEKVQPMTKKDYSAEGCTALLDAIGTSINNMINIQKNLKEKERAEKVLFIITTDGYENSSREYSYSIIKNMIKKEKRIYNWEFLFLGANIDAAESAENIGIERKFAANYTADSEGIKTNYEVMSDAVSCCRRNIRLDETWKDKIEKRNITINRKILI